MRGHHREWHRGDRAGWLRAAVLGANDGLISTASLLLGIAAAGGGLPTLLTAGIAAAVAGAFSMAAGEYVSVSSQADAEAADLQRERRELAEDPAGELEELVALQRARGLPEPLARAVAEALSAHDALGAHARDELGVTEHARARPLQAALASATAFASGAGLALLACLLAPGAQRTPVLVVSSLLLLAGLGALAASLGGATPLRAALRMLAWGGLAMAATWLAGRVAGGFV